MAHRLDTGRKRQWDERATKKKEWKERALINQIVNKDTTHVHSSSKSNGKKSLPKPNSTRTLSLAVPGSILANAQSLDLKTILASQIARAAAIFRVDEIIVFDEEGQLPVYPGDEERVDMKRCLKELLHGQKYQNPSALLALFLQYLECPQYLRRQLFPQHPCLSKVGTMPPLAIPSHVMQTDEVAFREGVIIANPVKPDMENSNMVNVGLHQPMTVKHRHLPLNTRVTVRVKERTLVSPREPVLAGDVQSWGFSVRLVNRLSGVFRGCPFHDGGSPGAYDLVLGTSERGENLDTYTLPDYKHLLIVFGGVLGLEKSLQLDETLSEASPADLCHSYLNTCPEQGSRTIRTEEAIFITMSALRPKLSARQKS